MYGLRTVKKSKNDTISSIVIEGVKKFHGTGALIREPDSAPDFFLDQDLDPVNKNSWIRIRFYRKGWINVRPDPKPGLQDLQQNHLSLVTA